MGLFNNKLSDQELLKLVRDNDNGDKAAQQKFAELFDQDNPDFVDRVCKARLVIYKDAAQAGDRNAILTYASSLCRLGRKNEGIDWYMKLINKGDTKAMLELSWQYCEYGGLGPDPKQERFWLKKAAEKGDGEAQYQMGREMLIAQDKISARLWYERSATQNHPEGKAGFAQCLIEENENIWALMRGIDHNNGYAGYLTKKYGKPTQQEWEKIMRNIWVQAQTLFIQALNETREEDTAGTCCNALSRMYLYPPQGIPPRPYLAAYYAHAYYRETNQQYGLDRCKEIIREQRLKITDYDLREWEKMSIWAWGKKHGISV